MFNLIKPSLRALLVALVLGGAAVSTAEAGRSTARDEAYASQTKSVNHGDADLGLLWIVIGVVVLVFFVWVCARIGDNRPADGQMN